MLLALPAPSSAADAANPPSPGNAQTATAAIFVHAYRITGNTVLSTPVLLRETAAYSGRAVSDIELQALLRRLTALHADAGFATTRATLPDQDVADGVVDIVIVEGFLERIVVTGTHALDPAYVSARLGAGVTTPLNVTVLDANMRLLMQERGIGKVRGQLRPGNRPGAAVLHVEIEEVARFEAGLRVANDRAPAVGSVRGAIEGSVHNLFGRGDVVDLSYGHAEGLRYLDFRLTSPLNSLGTDAAVRYIDANADLVDEQFAILGATTEVRGYEAELSQDLLLRATRQVGLSARLTSRTSESFLFGQPHSFSPGAVDGRADIRAARLALNWTERRRQDVLSARLSWSIGLAALGATVHDDLPDSRFHTALLQAQWQHRFAADAGVLAARVDSQIASDALLPLEKFVVGGMGSVRGYRRARFVRDNGWTSSLEYRLPVSRFIHSSRGRDVQLDLVVFLDAGRSWNHKDNRATRRTLLAAGPGLRFDWRRLFRAELYWGGLRRDLDDGGDDLQDHGVHFVLRTRTGL